MLCRYHHWTLAGLILGTTGLWADTPVKPAQASFSNKKAPDLKTMTVEQAEKLLAASDKETPTIVEKNPLHDYPIKAASIEVAWLQDAATFPLHLRAEIKSGEDVIALTGYVPSERLREKAVQIAKLTVGAIAVQDMLVVQPNMAWSPDMPVDPQQARFVQDHLEKAVPGTGKTLHILVDHGGVTTVAGKVDEFGDRLKIIRALQGFPGCTAIRYDLRVTVPAQITTASNTVAVPFVSLVPPPLETKTTPVVKSAPTVQESKQTPATALKLAADAKPAASEKSIPVPPPIKIAPPAPALPAPTQPITSSKTAALTKKANKSKSESAVTASACSMIQAGCVAPLQQPPVEKVAASSLSGLLPPGMSGFSTEPEVQLGSPVILRASHSVQIVVDMPESLIRTSDVSKSSTVTTPETLPALESTPIPINVMPRLAK